MIVDGKKIADAILDEVASSIAVCGKIPHLVALTCAPTFATEKFLKIKQRAAERVGMTLSMHALDAASSTDDVMRSLSEAIKVSDGIIVQLPFPKHIDIENVLRSIPATHDVDAIGAEMLTRIERGEETVLSPVVGAIAEITDRHEVTLKGKDVVIIGKGRLVGMPAAVWCKNRGARVTVLDKESDDINEKTKNADVLILGAGVPKMITPEMVKEGVVIFDAGTSEDAGELVGDADPMCAEKASLFTPVPGGIGPITVAIIFKNLLTLAMRGHPNN